MAAIIDAGQSITYLIPHLGNTTLNFTRFANYVIPLVTIDSTLTPPPEREFTEDYMAQLQANATDRSLLPIDSDLLFVETFVFLMLPSKDVPNALKSRRPAVRSAVAALYDRFMSRLFEICLTQDMDETLRATIFDAIVHREHSLSPLTVDMVNSTIDDMLNRSLQIPPVHSVLIERARYGATFGELLVGSSVEIMDFVGHLDTFIESTLLNRRNHVCFQDETVVLLERADAQIRNILSLIIPLLWVNTVNKAALLRRWCFLTVLTDTSMAPIWPFLPLNISTYRQLANALLRCVCTFADAPMITSNAASIVVTHFSDFLQFAETVGNQEEIDRKIHDLSDTIAGIPIDNKLSTLVTLTTTSAPFQLPYGEWGTLFRDCIVKMVHSSYQTYALTFMSFLGVLGIVRDNLSMTPQYTLKMSEEVVSSVRFSAGTLTRQSISEDEFTNRVLAAAASPLIVGGRDKGCLSLYADVSGLRYSYIIPGNACETQHELAWNTACNFARNRVALIVTGNV
jgi:hypothetical protein